ncbi:GNAT family N-acetyltransferase [Ralstonia mannitolilytica]|uniref:Acetyltransferase n=1 Tax=Ralstonia mannitolilytica TaxID=105219 RepID=A0AAD2AHG1_9RALS|nr:GNAT family N-acetyltransferase [Ralstonia mannitolilytica]ATG19818.1 GNAT family N-acetyltransferase [Ralstonia pickettii]ANA34814.1 GCN5 family acetyltransferase [Ralstonia mannitolilytica]MBY4719433.1 GNAT family N-acetyltransferase [Ralstonia mannitolilytica]CAJ0679288.1 Acetyltransferase [Ralstonia mannitolilytica]CAJ0682430.1 Acetyltransferase [Ralstonia mannitolilytica]
MPFPEIIVTDAPEDRAVSIIGDGLDHFNDVHVGYGDRRPLAVLVRDPHSGEVLGGASGRTSLGLLFLDLFYLPETLRGMGVGTEVLRRFEEEGRRRGCRSAVLYTISFQAPQFYERHGWVRFGEVPCDPPGTSRVFLSKAL